MTNNNLGSLLATLLNILSEFDCRGGHIRHKNNILTVEEIAKSININVNELLKMLIELQELEFVNVLTLSTTSSVTVNYEIRNIIYWLSNRNSDYPIHHHRPYADIKFAFCVLLIISSEFSYKNSVLVDENGSIVSRLAISKKTRFSDACIYRNFKILENNKLLKFESSGKGNTKKIIVPKELLESFKHFGISVL